MQPDPIEGIGEGTTGARSPKLGIVVGVVVGTGRGPVGATLSVLVDGLVFMAVARPHR